MTIILESGIKLEAGITLEGNEGPPPPPPGPSGLTILLDANDPASYPGTGTTVYDVSGNGWNHVFVSMFGSPATIFVNQDGIKSFAGTPDSPGWNYGGGMRVSDAANAPLLGTNYTYISWAKMKGIYGYPWLIMPSRGNSMDWENYDVVLGILAAINNYSMLDYKGNDGSEPQYVSYNYDVSSILNTWKQWAVVSDNTGIQLYVNAQPVGTKITNPTRPGNWRHCGIGGDYRDDGAFFGRWGNVANMYFYQQTLTQQQIADNFNQLRSRFGV